MHDYHVHSNYSDGRFLFMMLDAAAAAGLDGVGFADHCNVSPRDRRKATRARYGFNLDQTYERRRRGIEEYRSEYDLAVYDAVEMDYDPRDEAAIRAFLDDAGFDYAIGSVHELDGRNVQRPSEFADDADAELDALADEYFDRLVALVESELFDVAAHPDLLERNEYLRGRATREHYRRAAEAFAESRTVPEVNAGRALTDASVVHPSQEFLELLCEYEVPVSVATDAHSPDQLRNRADFLDDFLAEWNLDPVSPPSLDR